MADRRQRGSNAMRVYSWARHCMNDGERIFRGAIGLVVKHSISGAIFV